MAFAHSEKWPTDLDNEIIPTAIIIKNIPLNWKTDHVLHLMSQMKLPPPSALNYMYDDFKNFRGMAFATFASSVEAWHVIQKLNRQWVCGRALFVQYKRKRPATLAMQDFSTRATFQPKHHSHTDVRDMAYVHPQEKASPVPRATREQTPASESYNLLMHYQKEPAEKEKLKKFLVRTRDYQEAINEFAKNRVREVEEGGYGTSTEIPPILEMRPATPGELEQIADMENRFGLSDEACSCGPLIIKHGEEQNVTGVTKDTLAESINLASLGRKSESASAEQGVELDPEKDKEGVEKGGAEIVMKKKVQTLGPMGSGDVAGRGFSCIE